MNLNAILKTVEGSLKIGGKFVVKHLPTILTAVGSAGVVAGVILTAKKAPDAKVAFDEVKEQKPDLDKADYVWKLVKVGAKHYGVVCLVIGGSIVAFWLANHINLKRLTAALAAAKVSSDYAKDLEDQIKKEGGDKALVKAKDEINAEKIQEAPPIPFGADQLNRTVAEVPVFDPITRGWMISSADKIRRARSMVIEELESQLEQGSDYAFIPYSDFLAWCGMKDSGPASCTNPLDEYFGFGVHACGDHTYTTDGKKKTYYDIAQEAVDVDWTSGMSGDHPVLVLRYDAPPRYINWKDC